MSTNDDLGAVNRLPGLAIQRLIEKSYALSVYTMTCLAEVMGIEALSQLKRKR